MLQMILFITHHTLVLYHRQVNDDVRSDEAQDTLSSGSPSLRGNPIPVGTEVRSGEMGLYGRNLGDCVARSFPLMDIVPIIRMVGLSYIVAAPHQ